MRRVRLGVLAAWAAAAVLFLPRTLAAQAPEWPSEPPPRPLSAREVKFPPYATRTLANGLRVIAVSHHEQPTLSLRLLVRAGSAQDPPKKPGVAALLAAVLDQGTKTRSAEQVATAIDSIGGALGSSSGSDLTFLTAVVMKDSFAAALDLVSDIARNPAIAQEEIDRQRQQMLSGLKVSYEDPEYLAGVVFDRLVYGFHPYGRPAAGTPESIASITREDLAAFHKTWFGANNAILAIVGDITADEAFAGAERVFGSWGPSESTAGQSIDPPPPTRRVVIIDRPDAVQTEIRVGNAGLPRKHPDYLALDLAVKILGGEGGNRLHRVLRSERGLTYGASADINAFKDAGDIVAETDTRSETTGEALRLLVDEFWRLQRQRVHPRELADAQAYLTGSFPLTIETPSAIALQILNAVVYGLDLSELETYRERVNAITVDDIQRVARQYLLPDRLSIVLVGDASTFGKQLAGVGFDQVELIPMAELDLTSADLRRPTTSGGRMQPIGLGRETAVSAAHDSAARELIDRAVQAKGGLARLTSIRTMKVTASTVVQTEGGRIEVPSTTSIRYPGAFRVDARFPAGTVAQVFNAGEYWIQDARGAREAPPALAAEIRSNVQRDAVAMLLALAEGRLEATRSDMPTERGARPAIRVQSPGARPVTLVFDPQTYLLTMQRYEIPGPPAGSMEEAYSDYRVVDGVQVAFKAVVRRNGVPFLERTVHAIEFNVPLDRGLFTKPS
jgi:zinc protease